MTRDCDHDGCCTGQTRTKGVGHHIYVIVCDRCKRVTQELGAAAYDLQPILGLPKPEAA